MHRLWIAIGLTSVMVGCGSAAKIAESSPGRIMLRVAAASDLQAVLPELIARFQSNHPIDVTPVFGASGQLTQQIKQGAPFDVFLSANQSFVKDLADRSTIDPSTV